MNRLPLTCLIARRTALLALCLTVLAPGALSPTPVVAAPAKKASAKRSAAKTPRKSTHRKAVRRGRGSSSAFARAYKRHQDEQMILHAGPVTGPMFSNRW